MLVAGIGWPFCGWAITPSILPTVSRHGTNELLATPLVRNVSAARNMHAGLNHPPSAMHCNSLGRKRYEIEEYLSFLTSDRTQFSSDYVRNC